MNQQSVGEYKCIAWFGSAALASIPAKLLLANISSTEENRRNTPPQVYWKVPPGNSILIQCGEVNSNPPPVWSFYK